MIIVLKVLYFFDIICFQPAVFRLPLVIAGLTDIGFTADILNSSPHFDGFQNSDDLVFSKSDLTHSDDIITMAEDL